MLWGVVVTFFYVLQLTSQHPYAEMFIGKPHVYTIDISDADQVRASLKEMMASTVREREPTDFLRHICVRVF